MIEDGRRPIVPPMLSGAIWRRIGLLEPVVTVPRSVATGKQVLVDCLLAAATAEGVGPEPMPDSGVCLTRLLTPQQAGEVALAAELDLPGEAALSLLLGPAAGWPVLRLDQQAFGHLVGPGRVGGPTTGAWLTAIQRAARRRLGLAMDAPGEPLCPVFASPRWQGASGATLLATPADCATVCLDIQLCACLDRERRLDWARLGRAMIHAVRLGNAVMDDLPLADSMLGNQSMRLRRLGLHLADLGELAVRMGMEPHQPSTLSRLRQVIKVAADAAMGESLRLGRLHGPFPALLEADWVRQPVQPGFRWRIQALMDRFCLRNSQLLVLSPHSIMGPAVTADQLLAWANLIPLLACVEGFSARLPPTWADLPPQISAGLLGRIWALGRYPHQVRTY